VPDSVVIVSVMPAIYVSNRPRESGSGLLAAKPGSRCGNARNEGVAI
jgi:hypothetical protein